MSRESVQPESTKRAKSDQDTPEFQVEPVRSAQERQPYRVPQHPAPVDLHLDGNEGQAPAPALYQALLQAGIEAAARYPSANALEAWLAQRWEVPQERVLVTAGGDDAIDRLSRVMLAEGKELLFPTPSFEMMARYGEVAGGTLIRIPWTPGAPYPIEQVLEKVSENTGIIAVISPNNPTGTTTSMAIIERLAHAAPHAVILLDLAYIEFADQDLTLDALHLPNVAVTRTLSKAWGLAGLRVGYALAHPDVIEWMRVAGEPYAVSGTSLVLAEARLRQAQDEVDAFIIRVRQNRTSLERCLADLGAEVTPSQANFAFAKLTPEAAAWTRDGLAGFGISIRSFPENPTLQGSLRITAPGNAANTARLEHALRTTLSPEALLFDVDGVLVDVSRSYREAIIQTAAAFGITVTPDQITQAKAKGNANNDWLLTQKLLALHGKEIPLEQVTEQFEALYQGTPKRAGLRSTETLLVSASLLRKWHKRYPLGVITGRPRKDAAEFLRRFGLKELFDAVVCMEDAPAKPNPAPIHLALKQLGVAHAWMLGDTPDDIRAARHAQALPIGVCAAPNAPSSASLGHQNDLVKSLFEAGAAQVLSEAAQLDQLLDQLPQKARRKAP